MENEVENSKRYYVIMLLQRRSFPSTIFFNNTMQLSMYMRLTTNATIQKALPAHSLITFTTFGTNQDFPLAYSPSPQKKSRKKRGDSK